MGHVNLISFSEQVPSKIHRHKGKICSRCGVGGDGVVSCPNEICWSLVQETTVTNLRDSCSRLIALLELLDLPLPIFHLAMANVLPERLSSPCFGQFHVLFRRPQSFFH